MRIFFEIFFCGFFVSSTILAQHCGKDEKFCLENRRPNFLLILADDLGYGDLACYGHPTQEWGPLDRLAAEGIRFTQFYSADSLCSPSRAALLTGRLPVRIGIFGRDQRVFLHDDSGGLPKHEITIAEALKNVGYKTGLSGKWHLGVNENSNTDGAHLPKHHGFDFVGHNLPFTKVWECDETGIFSPEPDVRKCFLYFGDRIVQQPIDQATLTTKMIGDFSKFLTDVKTDEKSFFFFFSFPQIHSNPFASTGKFANSSKRGLIGGDINEMQWAIGELIKNLDEFHLREKTLVFFLSDHGPHREICLLGGESGGFKGGKQNSWEGGFRIPAIASWPGVIRSGLVSQVVLSALDFFPTFLNLAESPVPDFVLDGEENSEFFLGKSFLSFKNRTIFFYCRNTLMALRYGQFKFHFYSTPISSLDVDSQLFCPDGIPLKDWYLNVNCPEHSLIKHSPPIVYHLERDPYERYPLINVDKNLLKTVDEIVENHMKSLKPLPEPILGKRNEKLIPCCDPPKCKCNYPDKLK